MAFKDFRIRILDLEISSHKTLEIFLASHRVILDGTMGPAS